MGAAKVLCQPGGTHILLAGWPGAMETRLCPEMPSFLGTCFPEGTSAPGEERSEQTNVEIGPWPGRVHAGPHPSGSNPEQPEGSQACAKETTHLPES